MISSLSQPVVRTCGGRLLLVAAMAGLQSAAATAAPPIIEFTAPTASSAPYGIAAGPDGNLWFTEAFGNKISRITPAGVINEFPIPGGFDEPQGITTGPDGNLWFTLLNKIGRLSPRVFDPLTGARCLPLRRSLDGIGDSAR